MPIAIRKLSAEEARDQLARVKTTLSNVRKKGAVYGGRVMTGALTIAGGAAAGYIAAKFPGKFMKVEKEIWLGGALVAAGVLGLGGEKMSDSALALGAGVLSAVAYNKVKTRVLEGE